MIALKDLSEFAKSPVVNYAKILNFVPAATMDFIFRMITDNVYLIIAMIQLISQFQIMNAPKIVS